MSVRLHTKITLLVAAAFLLSSPASAALIDNGTSMIDTSTNLEWLDLDQTLGQTWNQANAGNPGWVHATTGQVDTMFANAGFLLGPNINDPSNDPAANLLLSILGCTQFCGTVNATGRGFAEFGAGSYRPNYHNGGLGSGYATISLFSASFDLADTTSGNYMVRVIPEPGTAVLFGLGLTIMAAVRRRRA